MDDEEGEFTPQERNRLESVMAEIKFASHDLHDLLQWIAHNDEYDEDEFVQVLGPVYSFARAKNPSMKEDDEQDESAPPPDEPEDG